MYLEDTDIWGQRSNTKAFEGLRLSGHGRQLYWENTCVMGGLVLLSKIMSLKEADDYSIIMCEKLLTCGLATRYDRCVTATF